MQINMGIYQAGFDVMENRSSGRARGAEELAGTGCSPRHHLRSLSTNRHDPRGHRQEEAQSTAGCSPETEKKKKQGMEREKEKERNGEGKETGEGEGRKRKGEREGGKLYQRYLIPVVSVRIGAPAALQT